MMIKKRHFKEYVISIILFTTIFVLCMINPASLPASPMNNFDKFVHLVMFLGLSGTVFFENTSYFRKPIRFRRLVLGSFLFPIFFSGFIELMQEHFSHHRTGDWMDFLYDTIGVSVGSLICLVINQILSSKRKK